VRVRATVASVARKRDKLKAITSGWAGRTWATGKLAASVGVSVARRAVLSTSPAADQAWGESLASQLDSMKGLAMKIGQMVSYLDGAMPAEAQRVLRRVQQGAQPLEFAIVRESVEVALGAPLEDLFDRFDEEPIAAASIGQVHRAALDGRELAVKVQYPNIRATFDVDFGQLDRIAGVASLATAVDGHAIVKELHDRLEEECDYQREARCQELFRQLHRGDPGVIIPDVIHRRSAATVLSSSFEEGREFHEFCEDASQEERNRAGALCFRFSFASVFGHAVFNADPHPGNYRFPGGGRVVFLDFGCVRFFEPEFIERWKRLAWCVLENRRDDFRDVLEPTGLVGNPAKFDYDEYWRMMGYLYEPFAASWFEYRPEYVERVFQFTDPRYARGLRHVGMPAEWVWLMRLQYGLNSVLTHLRAEGDYGSLYRDCLSRTIDAATLEDVAD
jgi:predicted unusual protein kinase regulating ubiquinone biosynthesis (AarF/ABC1/UbiB family)